jgi:hypothetical protein
MKSTLGILKRSDILEIHVTWDHDMKCLMERWGIDGLDEDVYKG